MLVWCWRRKRQCRRHNGSGVGVTTAARAAFTVDVGSGWYGWHWRDVKRVSIPDASRIKQTQSLPHFQSNEVNMMETRLPQELVRCTRNGGAGVLRRLNPFWIGTTVGTTRTRRTIFLLGPQEHVPVRAALFLPISLLT